MITLKLHYSNKTEIAVFHSRWAAELTAEDWMTKDSRLEQIDIVENGYTVCMLIRKGE